MDIAIFGNNGAGGTNGATANANGTAGKAGESVTATAPAPHWLVGNTNSAEATGGAGGKGGDGYVGSTGGAAGAGGAGGTGTATALTDANSTNANWISTAIAYGGTGGAAGAPGAPAGAGANGGAGGAARASATIQGATTGILNLSSYAYGGSGGNGVGVGHSAGAGGVATTTAKGPTNQANTHEHFLLQAISGSGGLGLSGANGGAGGAVSMVKPVTGSSGGAPLQFSLSARAGNGGNSAGGVAGIGGAANTSFVYDDTQFSLRSTSIDSAAFVYGGTGGNGTSGANKYSAGAAGGAATASVAITGVISPSNDTSHVEAQGGAGGQALANANGGRGGAANATAATTATGGDKIWTQAIARGGAGGGVGTNGDGGNGGTAKASVKGTSNNSTGATGGDADSGWSATAIGGNGGAGDGSGHKGGVGGAATGTSVASSTALHSVVDVSVVARGGTGGTGYRGATGGAGGAGTLTNAVSGFTNAGELDLGEASYGGKGGDSAQGTGGAGGAATASLTFNDTTHTDKSQVLSAHLYALGGNGGTGHVGYGGNGGAATATLNLIGAQEVDGFVQATAGHAGDGLTPGIGGAAIATSIVSGKTVDATADADVAEQIGAPKPALASALATGKGVSGTFDATAHDTMLGSPLVLGLAAEAKGVVDGTATNSSSGTAVAKAAYSSAMPAFDTTSQAVAEVIGTPTTGDIIPVLTANENLRTTFSSAATPSFFAMGELGGAYDVKGVGQETTDSDVRFLVDPSKLADPEHLVLGFYNATKVGAGPSSISLDVKINGAEAKLDGGGSFAPLTFNSGDAAAHALNDMTFDLGDMTSSTNGLNSMSYFVVDIDLKQTSSTAGSGFYLGFLAGDPPAGGSTNAPPTGNAAQGMSMDAASAHSAEFTKALFDGFFGNGGTDMSLAAPTHQAATPLVAANPAMPHASQG